MTTLAIFRRPSREFEEQVKNGRIAALALPGPTPSNRVNRFSWRCLASMARFPIRQGTSSG